MSRYSEAPDADDEPTIWETWGGAPNPIAVMRRCDLPYKARHLWDEFVKAVCP